jgi:hypothetical protein
MMWIAHAPLLWLLLSSNAQQAPVKSVIDLQPFRQSSSLQIKSKAGADGVATLINLNPAINVWYVLQVAWSGRSPAAYHLENPNPRSAKILLDEKYPSGIIIAEGANRHTCEIFATDVLDQAKAAPRIFDPLCDGRLYLRNPAKGSRTSLETATEFLRDHIWGGEKIIGLGHVLMGDMNRETGKLASEAHMAPSANQVNLPLSARIDRAFADRLLSSANLGILTDGSLKGGLKPGEWYPASGNPGIFVSILQPILIDPAILASDRKSVNALDSVEASALCYLIAFDLDRFDLGFALGTEHPRVDWSAQVLPQMRNPGLPGPDGLGNLNPLIATGLVDPQNASKTVATFTGGFKRHHGAFKYGDLALQNSGSHYGFMENGVVFSKLQPGLATIFVLNDGAVVLKTWTEADNSLLARIKHARQNGVPLIESGASGPLVNRWGAGNWSGSENGKLRTMRAGAGLQTTGRKRFLIYAVFSDATPSAMARVFQGYQCDYAMLLDMNALEHTYLAIYRRTASQMFVDHLLKGMSVLEKSESGQIVPRFVGYADNRDFFYMMRR